MKDLVEEIAKALVDHPEGVRVNAVDVVGSLRRGASTTLLIPEPFPDWRSMRWIIPGLVEFGAVIRSPLWSRNTNPEDRPVPVSSCFTGTSEEFIRLLPTRN